MTIGIPYAPCMEYSHTFGLTFWCIYVDKYSMHGHGAFGNVLPTPTALPLCRIQPLPVTIYTTHLYGDYNKPL